MSQRCTEISDKLKQFIQKQKIFFLGTATSDSRINIYSKDMDSLRVLSKNRVVWLNVTGSGNETTAHIQENSRMTVIFTTFEVKSMILRLYGKAKVTHQFDPEWGGLLSLFENTPGQGSVRS
jgi:hypothetical protein